MTNVSSIREARVQLMKAAGQLLGVLRSLMGWWGHAKRKEYEVRLGTMHRHNRMEAAIKET